MIEIKHRLENRVLFTVQADTLKRANLSDADLRGANLSGANLYSADLSDANLSGANLSGANLYSADLSDANLSGANLSDADLRGADLYSADLRSANLSGANLSGAYLYSADLRSANLSGANLSGANLSGANLKNCVLPDFQICPEKGCFRAFKKTVNGVIEIEIAASARRTSSLIGRKCRAERVRVVSGSAGPSLHDNEFVYEIGKEASVPDFDDDIRVECTRGIHFFMTRREAEEY